MLILYVNDIAIGINFEMSRVGFGLFKHLFLKFGTEIVVANGHNNEKLDSEDTK